MLGPARRADITLLTRDDLQDAQMAKLRYIGSKARIAEAILDSIGRPSAAASTFVDVFSGTGAVSRAAALRGWRILANDYLYSSSVMSKVQLLSPEDVLFRSFGDYQTCMRHLHSSTLPKWNTHFLFIL